MFVRGEVNYLPRKQLSFVLKECCFAANERGIAAKESCFAAKETAFVAKQLVFAVNGVRFEANEMTFATNAVLLKGNATGAGIICVRCNALTICFVLDHIPFHADV